MYHKYKLKLKKKKLKITLPFETNDEHQSGSYQNALRYNVIIIKIKLTGKTNDK
jgi:hypothetical protein